MHESETIEFKKSHAELSEGFNSVAAIYGAFHFIPDLTDSDKFHP